jgi:hypothetical protein
MRRLDAVNQRIDGALRAMRNGAALHFQPGRSGGRWQLSNGRRLTDEAARLIVCNPHIVNVDHALFRGSPAQTYRYAWTKAAS